MGRTVSRLSAVGNGVVDGVGASNFFAAGNTIGQVAQRSFKGDDAILEIMVSPRFSTKGRVEVRHLQLKKCDLLLQALPLFFVHWSPP